MASNSKGQKDTKPNTQQKNKEIDINLHGHSPKDEEQQENLQTDKKQNDVKKSEKQTSARYTKSGRRKGLHKMAAPLGFIILILATVGVVFLVRAGVNFVKVRQDDTELKEDIYYFIQPVFNQNPPVFSDINLAPPEAFLKAAIGDITNKEFIRMEQEKDSYSNYSVDENGRLLIPVNQVEQAYNYLFGPDAKIHHMSLDTDQGATNTYEYDQGSGFYHVPMASHESMYVAVIDSLKYNRKQKTYEAKVGYVADINLTIDDHGKEIPPKPEDADFFKIYKLQRRDIESQEGWILKGIYDEEGKKPQVVDSKPPQAHGSDTTNSITGYGHGDSTGQGMN